MRYIVCLLMFLLTGCVSIPHESTLKPDLTINPILYLRVRIVNEIVITGPEDAPLIDFAREPADVDADIDYANNLLYEAGIQLVASQRELWVLDDKYNKDFFLKGDAKCYDDCVSIYYLFPRPECFVGYRGFYQIGFGPFPWLKEYGKGLVLYGKLCNKTTLVHEISHVVGGLQHTFSPANTVLDVEMTADPSYHNVMNYSQGENVFFTAGQLDLIYCSTVTWHRNCIIMERMP